jgi:hypothetical protein
MPPNKLTVRRKGYTRKDGTKVKASTFKITDRGKPGRGPKTLPPISKSPKDSLGRYGYKVSLSFTKRKEALHDAIKGLGFRQVIARLNLIRNYSQSVPENHVRLSRDVDYVSGLYKKFKARQESKSKKSSKTPAKKAPSKKPTPKKKK